MLKEKRNNNKDKGLLKIVGSFLIFIGLFLVIVTLLVDYKQDKKDKDAIEVFFEMQEQIIVADELVDETSEITNTNAKNYNYIAVIEIPKINLKQGFFDKGSYYNNVDKNIKILNESDMPDKEYGNIILAGHSGTGRAAYFKNLKQLAINDEIYIYYKGIKYIYKVSDIYDVEKTGKINIKNWANKTTLTLITCRSNTNKQIVIVSELINEN